ncbi:MAG: hypothetical protein LBK56_12700 [Gracilibacteraceae bacterium]|jgi:hypothetical protein|nr:hypothetical protein [Gracilibacteraceae bacterium]
MDYENLYASYAERNAVIKSRLAVFQNAWKRLAAKMEKGDLKNAGKDIAAMEEAHGALADATAAARETVSAFDYAEYMASGEFTRQFLACCETEGLDVRGEKQTYEIFPYRIRMDAENCDVFIDRRKAASFRPKKLASVVRKSRDKLFSAAFDPQRFASELAAAYDLCILRHGSEKTVAAGADVFLRDLYAYLTPMQRFRQEYTRQTYAFDLARLFMVPDAVTADDRRYQFGPSRYSSKSIRITDREGNEHFLATIRFFANEE